MALYPSETNFRRTLLGSALLACPHARKPPDLCTVSCLAECRCHVAGTSSHQHCGLHLKRYVARYMPLRPSGRVHCPPFDAHFVHSLAEKMDPGPRPGSTSHRRSPCPHGSPESNKFLHRFEYPALPLALPPLPLPGRSHKTDYCTHLPLATDLCMTDGSSRRGVKSTSVSIHPLRSLHTPSLRPFAAP